MKNRKEGHRASGEDPRIQNELVENLNKQPNRLLEEDRRKCVPESDEDGDFDDCCENRSEGVDEDEEFDNEDWDGSTDDEEFDEDEDLDWDDTWDEYMDRQNRDSGMRRHRTSGHDSEDPLRPVGT